MPRLDLAAQRRTVRGRWQMLFVLLACAAPVIASYFAYYVWRPQSRSNYAELIDPPREIPPALALRDLQGQGVSARSLHGQWLLVVVGPSSCDSACESRLLAQRQLREMTGRERDRIDKVWLVTDDAPLRPALRDALAATPATTVLRVAPADVAGWLAAAPGQALESHLYLVDPMGRWMMRTPPELEASKFKRDLERLLKAAASWDNPGR